MRQRRYLNAMLTTNAILLGALVWTQLAETPGFDRPAVAAPGAVQPGPFPNAAEQRAEMIHALKSLQTAIDAQTDLLHSGRVRVQVTNLPDLAE